MLVELVVSEAVAQILVEDIVCREVIGKGACNDRICNDSASGESLGCFVGVVDACEVVDELVGVVEVVIHSVRKCPEERFFNVADRFFPSQACTDAARPLMVVGVLVVGIFVGYVTGEFVEKAVNGLRRFVFDGVAETILNLRTERASAAALEVAVIHDLRAQVVTCAIARRVCLAIVDRLCAVDVAEQCRRFVAVGVVDADLEVWSKFEDIERVALPLHAEVADEVVRTVACRLVGGFERRGILQYVLFIRRSYGLLV